MTITAIQSDLESAPGVGPAVARALREIGIHQLQDLHGADPQTMYDKLCLVRGEVDGAAEHVQHAAMVNVP